VPSTKVVTHQYRTGEVSLCHVHEDVDGPWIPDTDYLGIKMGRHEGMCDACWTHLLVWGAGESSVASVRAADAITNGDISPIAQRWIDSCGRDDYWCVWLPLSTDTTALDADAATAGYGAWMGR
jgi:hypothetical protein